jgi:acetyl esterase
MNHTCRKDKRYILSESVMDFFFHSYVGKNKKEDVHQSHLANPLKNLNGLKNLPPAFVLTVDIDPLRDEGVLYAQELKNHQVEVKHSEYSGTFHGFWHMPFATHHKKAQKEMMQFIKEKLNF